MTKKFNIPLLDLTKEYNFLKKEIQKQLNDCLKQQSWILGPKVTEFEAKVAKYLRVKFAIGVASGTDALTLSLSALALKIKRKTFFDKKDEIITTPFTFIATAEAIIRAGATPVFVDIDPITFNIDPKTIKKAITKNTVGILPVHLYGLSCEMDIIKKIAKEYNLFIIEDTAQGFGGIYKGKKLGTIGDCGAFSFFPSKTLGGYGDGGLVATNNFKLADNVRILRNHGQIKRYRADYLGYNSRLDSIQAAILLAKLKYIDKFNQLRVKVAQKYNNALKDIKQIKVPKITNSEQRTTNDELRHIYHLYTIKVSSKRNQLLRFLNSKGIAARIYYPLALNKMKAFESCKVVGNLKNTKDVLSHILTLPIHPFLTNREIQYVTKNIFHFFNKRLQ